ncbi:uncharacterized protein KD926_003443 [Aspergillus affinis]|uniref:uncharacterized protein n=1 Tax=Aspergillus affinis TaxID=1070780 RepID=UPI0022FF17B2|nr:uncharacterized protein KD926_003443 [Aspergillus affinis]KAI9035480.1 hypothetical protein KD926_003443 [Aspergillus affinis]
MANTVAFTNVEELRAFMEDKKDGLRDGRHTYQFLSVIDFPLDVYEALDNLRLGARFTYDFLTQELGIRLIPGEGHERAHTSLIWNMKTKLMDLGAPAREVDFPAATRGQGFPQPSLLNPGANVVLLVDLNSAKGAVASEVLKRAEVPRTLRATRGMVVYSSEPRCIATIKLIPINSDTNDYRADGELRINFVDLMLRQHPAGGNQIAFTGQELEEWAQDLFSPSNNVSINNFNWSQTYLLYLLLYAIFLRILPVMGTKRKSPIPSTEATDRPASKKPFLPKLARLPETVKSWEEEAARLGVETTSINDMKVLEPGSSIAED